MMHDEEAAGTRCPKVHKIFRVGVKTRVGPVSGNNKKFVYASSSNHSCRLSIHLSISRWPSYSQTAACRGECSPSCEDDTSTV